MFEIFAAFVLGLFVGSFLNVCIHRLPRGQSIVMPPSHCPACGKTLGFVELIPLVSFCWQRGRCRSCRVKISWRYPGVELLTGLLFAILYRHFGLPEVLWQAVFYSILVAIFFIDWEHELIPNALVAALLLLTAAVQLFMPQISFFAALGGGVLGGGLFLLLAILSKGGMGGGDIKLMTVLGLWFGWQQTILLIFLAFFSGGIVAVLLLLLKIKKRKDAVPFGPFLVLSAFIVGMWGKQIITWYLRFSGLS